MFAFVLSAGCYCWSRRCDHSRWLVSPICLINSLCGTVDARRDSPLSSNTDRTLYNDVDWNFLAVAAAVVVVVVSAAVDTVERC